MKAELLLCLALVLGGRLTISAAPTNIEAQESANIWENINYPRSRAPFFSVTSSKEWGQVSRGLRLDVLAIPHEYDFFKTNSIVARLYRENGEIVEPTPEGKEGLNEPISTSWAAKLPDGQYAPQVMSYFPWGSNTLEEAWIEVIIGPERYWVEIPYGFDRNPADPLAPANTNGPPEFVPAMKSLTEHDHVVRWRNVEYDFGPVRLYQSNAMIPTSELALNEAPDLFSPRTAVRVVEADGAVVNARCVDLSLNGDGGRTDTFECGIWSANDTRCRGQIDVSVGRKHYRLVVPSSLYKDLHGQAREPSAIAYVSTLRVGMALPEADMLSRNYLPALKEIRNYPVACAEGHEYRCVFGRHAGEVMLKFNSSYRLVSWKGSSP